MSLRARPRGSGHEQPGECSGDSHDGGWRWGAPLGRVASLVQTGSAHRVGHRLVRLSAAPTLPRWSGACPALKLCFKAWTQGASGSALRALRQLTKVGCGLSELPRGTQIVSLSHAQCDGRITRLKTSQFKTISVRPRRMHQTSSRTATLFIIRARILYGDQKSISELSRALPLDCRVLTCTRRVRFKPIYFTAQTP